MRNCLKNLLCPDNRRGCYRLEYLVFIPLFLYTIVGCGSSQSTQMYENSIFGISFEKPENWDVKFNERSNSIVLEADSGIWDKNSARIGISNVPHSHSPFSSEQEIERYIEWIQKRYTLDSITIIQEPKTIESNDYEMATATILIPTMSLPEDSSMNQVGAQEPGIYQTVKLRVIKCFDEFAMISIYESGNEELNIEAEEIVNSIELNCSTEP